MARITIGVNKKVCPSTNALRAYRYSDIKAPDGWVDVNKFLPIPYDLMHLKIVKAIKPKPGWWTGKSWKGLHLKKKDKVIMWKRNHDFG